MHLKPLQQNTWGYPGKESFYTGPALEHYRCAQYLHSKTRHLNIVDTIHFFPHNTPFPEININNKLSIALDDIITTLQAPNFQHNNPLLNMDNQTQMALQLIAGILRWIIPRQSPPHSSYPHNSIASLPRVPPPVSSIHDALPRVSMKSSTDVFVNKLFHIYNKQIGEKETLCPLLKNDHTKYTLAKVASMEYGRLMTDNDTGTTSTDTMEPVLVKQDIPHNKPITYGSMVCNHRPLKPKPYRYRLVVSVNKLTYKNETAAPAANL